MSLLHRIIIAFVVLTSVGGSCPAIAGDVFRDHSRKGTAAYNLGHYTEAAQHFEAAYKVVQDPMMLFNLGQAYRLGGDSERALTAYRSYLRTAPEDAPNRERAERRVTELERVVAAADAERTERRQVTVESTPTSRPVALQATAPAPVTAEPVYRKWWFWTGAAAVAASVVVGAVLLSGGRSTSCGSTVDFCAPVRR